MTAGKKATLGTATVMAAALGYVALLNEPPGVHLCGRELCSGDTVISAPQPAPDKKVTAFKVQGPLVLYTSNANGRVELYAVAAVGGAVTNLSQLPPDNFRNVSDFGFTPDGLRAVYVADRDQTNAPARGDQDYELFSVSILGGPSVQLNQPLSFDFDVEHFAVSCDSQRVVYRSGKDSSHRWELWSANILGVGTPFRISWPATATSMAVTRFSVRCDGTALFWWEVQGAPEVPFVAPIAGGPIVAPVFVGDFYSGNFDGWEVGR